MLRRSWPLLRPHLLELFLATLGMMVAAFLDVFRPWPLKVVIDRVLSQRPSRVPFIHVWLDNAPFTRMQVLYGACGATVAIALLAGLLAYYYTKAMGSVGQHYVFGLRRDLFAHLQRLSLRFHDHQRTGDLTLRLMSDIKEIQDMLAGGIGSLATNICLLLGMLGLMLWVNWKFALVSLWLSPFLFLTTFRYRRRIKAASRKARKSTGLLAALAQETLASIRIVQGLAQEDRLDERLKPSPGLSGAGPISGAHHTSGGYDRNLGSNSCDLVRSHEGLGGPTHDGRYRSFLCLRLEPVQSDEEPGALLYGF